MKLSTGKILEENLVQSVFHQTMGNVFTFQLDNNLKHKVKYTLELFTKESVRSYSLDVNLLENLCQDLKMVV